MKFKFPSFKPRVKKVKEKKKWKSIKSAWKANPSKFTAIQLVLFALYSIFFTLFLATFILQISELVYDMDYNTKIAKNQLGAEVRDYEIKTNGEVTGNLVNGGTFSTFTDNMILINTKDNVNTAILTADKVLICVPNSGFIWNLLIGSKMFLVLGTSTILAIIAGMSKHKEKLIFNQSDFVRLSLIWMPGITYIFSLLTYVVVA